jgi:hypothetical protein
MQSYLYEDPRKIMFFSLSWFLDVGKIPVSGRLIAKRLRVKTVIFYRKKLVNLLKKVLRLPHAGRLQFEGCRGEEKKKKKKKKK